MNGAPALRLRIVLFVALVSGCGVGAKKNVIEGAMAADKTRAEMLEATARILDQHPEYVDEFYALARRHPALLHQFLADTARDLKDPELARPTAMLLAENPESLREMMVQSVDAARPRPQARAAIERAIRERRRGVTDMMTESPDTLAAALQSTLEEVDRKPGARRAFLSTMDESAETLGRILAQDPESIVRIMQALLREEARDPAARKKLLEALHGEK